MRQKDREMKVTPRSIEPHFLHIYLVQHEPRRDNHTNGLGDERDSIPQCEIVERHDVQIEIWWLLESLDSSEMQDSAATFACKDLQCKINASQRPLSAFENQGHILNSHGSDR